MATFRGNDRGGWSFEIRGESPRDAFPCRRCCSTIDDEYRGVDGRQERHDLEHDVKSAKGNRHLPDTRERNFFHGERGQGIA